MNTAHTFGLIAHVAVPIFEAKTPRLAYARRWAVSNLCDLKDPRTEKLQEIAERLRVAEGAEDQRRIDGARTEEICSAVLPRGTLHAGCLRTMVAREGRRARSTRPKRGNAEAIREAYRVAIHAAVIESGGNAYYTGEPLEWERISTYSNEESEARRRAYKRELALLPTVDHVGDGLGAPDFRICAWRTNDCKNDLTADELLAFCRRVTEYAQHDAVTART